MIMTEIRKKAREVLQGKWGKGVGITSAYLALFFVIGLIIGMFEEGSIIANILMIAQIIIEIPLTLGLVYSFIKLKRDEKVEAFDFIKLGFENFGRAWKLQLRVVLKMILPIICLVVSIALFGTVIFALVNGNGMTMALFISAIVVYIIGIFYAIVIGLLYALTFMVAYDNPEMSSLEVVNKSAQLMYGHRGDYFVLSLSFIGWAVLCIFSLGIGFLWLVPYMQTSYTCFYEEVLKLKEPKKEKEEEKAKKE